MYLFVIFPPLLKAIRLPVQVPPSAGLTRANKYRNGKADVPFGGELGKVKESDRVPNFSKQGEAIGKQRGRKPQKVQEIQKAEPKKKSGSGGGGEPEPAVESKPKRRRTGSQKTQVAKETMWYMGALYLNTLK